MFAQSGGVRGKRRRLVAGSLTIAVLLSLVAAAPAQAAPAAEKAKPGKPQAEELDRDGGPMKGGRAWPQKKVRDTPVAPPVWPRAATARVDLGSVTARSAPGSRRVRAGDLPVFVSDAAGAGAARLSSIDVQVVDGGTVPAAWRDGLMMRVSAPRAATAGAAKLSVDYKNFQQAYGAGWAARLKLWQVPQCALTIPDAAACRSVPLPTTLDQAAGLASATVKVDADSTAGRSFVALAAGASGSGGDFGATSLASSSTWSAGGNSGDSPGATRCGCRRPAARHRSSRCPTPRPPWTAGPR